MTIVLTSLVATTMLALPAESAARTTGLPVMATYQQQLVQTLAGRRSMTATLGAALLARGLAVQPGQPGFHDLIGRAAAAADAGPGVHWIQLLDCGPQHGTCPNQRALHTLQAQAADNAAVWLMVLASAAGTHDADAARDALARAADSTVFDDYSGVALRALARAVAAVPPPDTLYGPGRIANSTAGVRALLVLGLSSFQPLPGFQAIAAVCTQGAAKARTRHQCLQLAHILANGSAPLARSLGLHLESTLATDATARAEAAGQWRDLVWQMRQFGALALASTQDPQTAQRLLRLAAHARSRMDFILATLRASGIPVHAPAGWVPPGHPSRPQEPGP